MGSWKDEAFDKMQESREVRLAKALGINYEDLVQLSYEIEEDSSKDGYIYII